jgi:uncharacterized protein (TIGR02118 family)
MHVLIALYRAPEDRETFEQHYRETHTPLAKQMAGLRKMEVIWIEKMLTPPNDTLASTPLLQCSMYFDDADALKAGMKSDGGQAAAADLMQFAGPLVSMITGKVEAVAL